MRSCLPAILLVILLGLPGALAQTTDAALSKLQVMLLSRRSELQKDIHNIEQRLRVLDKDYRDKLEELEQLYAASRAVDARFAVSSDINKEIAVRSAALSAIAKDRSDCLEQLDCLYAGLAKMNREIADCDKALR